MTRPPEHDELLDDVLAESEPAGLRASALEGLLRQVGRRRRLRRLRRGAAIAIGCGLIALLGWRAFSLKPVAPSPSCEIVRTAPLPSSAIVTTGSFPSATLVASTSTVEVVSTRLRRYDLHFIGDTELLALVAPGKAALVRVGPGAQRLIFLPEDDAHPSAN